jgi:DNA polymerase III epsilon subunit-like protein
MAATPPPPPSADPSPADPSPGAPVPSEPSSQPAGSSRRDRRAGTRFVFVDTEATGLDHERHELTEVAWVVRFEDGREEERRFFPDHTTDGADLEALQLTHYEERIASRPRTPAREWLTLFLEDAQDAVLVGAVPDFDARHLERMCRKLGLRPTWDHHLLDVETLALPFLAPAPESPRSLAKTCSGLGIAHDKDQAHGALYDAQQAKRVFDRVWELVAQLRASGEPFPPPVPRDANGTGTEEPNTPADAPEDDPQLAPATRAEHALHHPDSGASSTTS